MAAAMLFDLAHFRVSGAETPYDHIDVAQRGDSFAFAPTVFHSVADHFTVIGDVCPALLFGQHTQTIVQLFQKNAFSHGAHRP